MANKALLRTGVIGTVIAVICCFTPVLVIALGAVGLSAWLAWLDFVLLPTVILFVAVTAMALIRRRRSVAANRPVTLE